MVSEIPPASTSVDSMQDPLHVDKTLQALRDAWEGQPELSLPTLFAMLQNQGIGWGCSDEELIKALRRLTFVHPPWLPLDNGRPSEGRWLLVTSGHRITVDAESILVRPVSPQGAPGQPVSFSYTCMRGAGPGRPLVVKDSEGFEHRFGIVLSAQRQRSDQACPEGLSRADIGNIVFVVRTEESMIVIDHGLHSFHPLRRELKRKDYSWNQIVCCRRGQALILRAGGAKIAFPIVEEIWVAEDPLSLSGFIG